MTETTPVEYFVIIWPWQTNDAFVAPLLRLNNCRLEEAERTLQQHGKCSELIILYQTKGQHTRALQLLRERAAQPDSSLRGHARTKNYLQHLGELQPQRPKVPFEGVYI